MSIFLILPGQASGDRFIDDLTVSYSDFSYITSIALGFHYVYFGTTGGVIRYNIEEEYWDQPLTGIRGLPNAYIKKLDVSFDDSRIVVGTDLGIFEYDEVFKQWTSLYDWPRYENRAKHLFPEGQYIAPWGFNYLTEGALADDLGRIFQLTDIVQDNMTNLWIGTWGLGPVRADEHRYTMDFLPYGLLQKDITTLYYDGIDIWIGGLVGESVRSGISIFNQPDNSFEYIETFGNLIQDAFDIFDMKSNGELVYVATAGGIKVIDAETRQIVDEIGRSSGVRQEYVQCLELTDDYLFAGTPDGLFIIELLGDSSHDIVRHHLIDRSILSLHITGDYLWIGTDRGGYRYHLDRKKFYRLKAPEITQNGNIFDIVSSEDAIWMATEDELISIDRQTADIELFPEVNNYGGIMAVAIKDSLVAAAVESGLLLIYNGDKPRSILFTEQDGLISNNIRDLIFIDQFLWLGTDKGLTRFWYENPDIY